MVSIDVKYNVCENSPLSVTTKIDEYELKTILFSNNFTLDNSTSFIFKWNTKDDKYKSFIIQPCVIREILTFCVLPPYSGKCKFFPDDNIQFKYKYSDKDPNILNIGAIVNDVKDDFVGCIVSDPKQPSFPFKLGSFE
jgi:hypothetical protein